ncbi:MAG: flagellar assembly protein FliH [Epsilonproteobacteria bacterium]|nr:flagellar assembly protein FliH [Campylobacterota bacterium]
MAEVISNQNIARHNVEKYNFKVLAIGSGAKKAIFKSFDKETNQQQSLQENTPPPQQETPSSENNSSSKDSIIESLLKKTDEMSSNFIKLQMKLESMQEEHKKELEMLKQSSFEEGVAKGKEEAYKECEAKYNETLNLFATSISKLESKANEYNNELEKLKNELTSAAIDIAKEVVSIELDQHSSQVAEALAHSLIEDLQNASKITLKVNPKDFTYISQNFQNLHHVKVVADNAVSEGGVIAISDIENIDAQIPNRFERVKRVILSE